MSTEAKRTPKFIATAVYTESMGYGVNWTIGKDRFHVWITEAGQVNGDNYGSGRPPLYKNSVAKFREPGHYDCRHLDANAAGNRKMIEAALAQVDLEKAKAEHDEEKQVKEAARTAEIEKRAAKERLEAAAPAMYEALEEILAICTESASDCRKRMGTRPGNCIAVAREALASARKGIR